MMANARHCAGRLRSIGSGGGCCTLLPAADAPGRQRRNARQIEACTVRFLAALAEETDSSTEVLRLMEREWFAARSAVRNRRRDSRAAAAVNAAEIDVDLLPAEIETVLHGVRPQDLGPLPARTSKGQAS